MGPILSTPLSGFVIRSFFVPDSNLLIKWKANGTMICSKALAKVEAAEVVAADVEAVVSNSNRS